MAITSFRIHHTSPSITTLVDNHDCPRYSIESHACPHSNGVNGNRRGNGNQISTVVRSVAQNRSYTGDSPDFWYDEIAMIQWRFQATSVVFGKRVVNVSSYLSRDSRFTNCRVFTGPGEQPLYWKLKSRGRGLELRHQVSGALVARVLPPRTGFCYSPKKPGVASLEVLPQYSKEPQLLNAIVITWAILDGIMRDKDIECLGVCNGC